MFLMEEAIKMGFSGNKLKGINLCRLYLRVITLADLCEVEGVSRKKGAWECKERMKSMLKWPTQKRPGPTMRNVWNNFLSQLVGDNEVLNIRLEKWKRGSVHLLWPVVLDQRNNKVFTRRGNNKFSHAAQSGNKFEGRGKQCQSIEADAIPVKAICSSSGIILKYKRYWNLTTRLRSEERG